MNIYLFNIYLLKQTTSFMVGVWNFLIASLLYWHFWRVFKPLDDDSESDPLAPMITWKDFQRLMPWEIVILVGGGYALAAGCKVLCICLCVLLYYCTVPF